MAKRKDPKELSPAYRKRLESYERRNPGAPRLEAAGKAKKPEPKPEPPAKPPEPPAKPPEPSKPSRRKAPKSVRKSEGPYDANPPKSKGPKLPKERSGNRRTKTPEEWSPAYRKRIESFFRRNPDGTLSEARRGSQSKDMAELSELEITIWSQKVKLGNIDLREAVGALDSDQAREGRAILRTMIAITTQMYETYQAGTIGYDQAQDELKALYKRLRALGLTDQSGDIEHLGDVGYH